MLWLLLAAQLSAPEPIKPLSWWSPDDMPAYHQRAGVTRAVDWRATISLNGRIESCEIERSSGDTKLDALTCSIIMKRGSFKPAKWIDGSTVQGVVRGHTAWAVGPNVRAIPTGIVARVDRLPKHVRSPAFVAVQFAVHEDGRISNCIAAPENKVAQLVTQACAALPTVQLNKPPLGPGGAPVRSVQQAIVTFVKK